MPETVLKYDNISYPLWCETNPSIAVEKEDTRLVDKCCPGFKEDKKRSTCIFDCSQCVTNECKLSNNCVCQPGFWGAECDLGLCLVLILLGPNCAEKCSCTKEIAVRLQDIAIWFNDQSTAHIDTNSSTRPNEIYINNGHLIFSVGAVVGILATVIIIVAVTFITTQSYKRNKLSILGINRNTKNGNLNGELSAVAIYTRSVFHASLPEPPVWKNPGFTTPLENRPKTSTLETRVICSMHLQNETNNRKDGRVVDELYDHPPSTGSYRAASIPEPPDNSLQMVSSQSKEHLYDEIPVGSKLQKIIMEYRWINFHIMPTPLLT
ncbi:hypothetical protein RI129_000909 [Pyrocoelia pectoralis]|uniref:Uncharacterized protein n=1 Tax=Pyrocoelia pectoralis TaxID=417401 RepID=A0AAN7ZJL6_9COLE